MMMLNLPNFLKSSSYSILIVGCGGGWDFMGAIPIIDSFVGKIVLANYSANCSDYLCSKDAVGSFPEEFVAPLIKRPFYVIGRHGALAVRQSLEKIIEEHKIDTLLLIDGGVDSLMHGDENGSGTILEDSIMLAAVKEIKDVKKYIATLGFGTETEEELNHYCALENIAQLFKMDGFLGSCALTKNMSCFKNYKNIQQIAIKAGAKPSHIHTKVIAAVEGGFGKQELEYDTRLSQSTGDVFINPLMALYWFYDLDAVIQNNIFVTLLEKTNTYIDAKMILRQNVDLMNKRPRMTIPL